MSWSPSVFQMGKLRPREQRQQAGGHTASRGAGADQCPWPTLTRRQEVTLPGLHLAFTPSFPDKAQPSSNLPGRHRCRWTSSGGGVYKERNRRKRKTFSWAQCALWTRCSVHAGFRIHCGNCRRCLQLQTHPSGVCRYHRPHKRQYPENGKNPESRQDLELFHPRLPEES